MSDYYNYTWDSYLKSRRKTCPICGKVFYTTPDYVYKLKYRNATANSYFCSYTCYQVGKRKKENKCKKIAD